MDSTMTRQERVVFCGLIGMLLLEDRTFTNDERVFLESLMTRLELDKKEREEVYVYARGQHDFGRRDIELLRRSGFADELMDTLREAALADGEVQPEEKALIDSIDEILRLRLGAKRYPVALDGLQSEPLDDLYIMEEQLGAGGFGVVVRARDRKTGQHLVIKKMRVEIAAAITAKQRADIEDRFWREVAILGQLTSPYCVHLLGAGFDVATPYMALEFIEGVTLKSVIRKTGGLGVMRTRRLMMHILHAIADAHTKGVLHRDLKPDNIMLSGAGSLEVARVLDFGFAGLIRNFGVMGHVSVTGKGDTIGTPSYMPPEQIMELSVKRPESDVYALGIILLECITGKKTLKGSLGEIIKWQLSKEPVPIPAEVRSTMLGPIIAKATQKDYTKRYSSAVAMFEAFEALPHDEVIGRSPIWTRLWAGFKNALGGS